MSGRQRQSAVDQPIRRFDERSAGGELRSLSINHFQQDRAEQFTFDQGDIEILREGHIKLQLESEPSLAESQLSGCQFRKVCLLRLQI